MNDHGRPSPMPAEPTTAGLEHEIRQTRAKVAADVTALKSQLDFDSLKDRAITAAERSAESIALQAARRLTAVPGALARTGRKHPLAAGAVGVGLLLVLWRAGARRRAAAHWWAR